MWTPSPLSELIEAFPLDKEWDRALRARDSICLWAYEEIGEPRDTVEEWMVENGITKRRVARCWTDPRQQAAVYEVEEAFVKLREVDDEFEKVRHIVGTWRPGRERTLHATLDEYIEILEQLEGQVHFWANEVCRLVDEAQSFVDEQLEEALAG
jgi:hypothetical protein